MSRAPWWRTSLSVVRSLSFDRNLLGTVTSHPPTYVASNPKLRKKRFGHRPSRHRTDGVFQQPDDHQQHCMMLLVMPQALPHVATSKIPSLPTEPDFSFRSPPLVNDCTPDGRLVRLVRTSRRRIVGTTTTASTNQNAGGEQEPARARPSAMRHKTSRNIQGAPICRQEPLVRTREAASNCHALGLRRHRALSPWRQGSSSKCCRQLSNENPA